MACSQCGFFSQTPSQTGFPFVERTARYEALSASNEAPLDLERAELSERLARAQEHSASLDDRLALIRATLDDLFKEKAAIEEYAEQTQAILHPSRRIPAEVLAEIFAFFVDDTMATTFEDMSTGNFVDVIDVQNGPMLLSRVSSHWRRTVLALPRLWANINLNFDEYSTSIATSRLLAEVLSRTSNAKLHVNIYSERDISDDHMLSSLLVTCDRWQSAGMALLHGVFQSMNSHITFDALERVRIHVHLKMPYSEVRRALASPSDAQHQACALLCAPRLRSISVGNLITFGLLFAVNWGDITHLDECVGAEKSFYDEFPHTHFVMIRTVLSFTAASLQCMRLEPLDYPPPQFGEGLGLFSNKALRHFVLGKIGADSRDDLLRLASLPALEVIHFTDPAAYRDAFPKPLSPSVGGAIRELSIFSSAEDASAFVALLRTTPNLRTLKICTTTCFDISPLCKSILVDALGLVPYLDTLEVCGAEGVEVTMRFVETLRARGPGIEGVAALRKVVVDYVTFGSLTEDVKTAFESLLADGLEGGLFTV